MVVNFCKVCINTCFTALYIFPLDSDEREKRRKKKKRK